VGAAGDACSQCAAGVAHHVARVAQNLQPQMDSRHRAGGGRQVLSRPSRVTPHDARDAPRRELQDAPAPLLLRTLHPWRPCEPRRALTGGAAAALAAGS